MFNLLNKSVKTINNGISTFISNITSESNYKTEIDFVKFGSLNLNLLKINNLKELENNQSENDFYFKEYNVLYIVYSKCYLNIYYLNDDLEFLCFFNQKFNFTVEKVGSILTSMNIFCSDKVPLIGIITNKEPNTDIMLVSSNVNFRGNIKQAYKNESYGAEYHKDYFHDTHNNIGEYCLKIYSLKTKSIVFNLRKKIKIENFISNRKILGLSFVNGRIEVFNTTNFEKILKIKSLDFLITKEIITEKPNNKREHCLNGNSNLQHNNFHHSNNHNSNALKINYVKDKNQVKSKISDNNITNEPNKTSGPLFDLTEDYIIFYNYKNKYTVYPSKKVTVNRRNRKSSDATRKSSCFEETTNQSKSSNRKNTKEKKTSAEKRKKEFSKIKNLPNKKSNSLSKSQSFGSRNDSSSNNNSKIKQINANNKAEKANKLNKNGFQKNYLNINYASNTHNNNNNSNDLYHQNSTPSETEYDYGSYNNNANPNAFDIISTDIYERMSKLTNWSFSQINDFKNLHQASNISNNNNLKLYSNSSIVTIIYFNYEEIHVPKESNIHILINPNSASNNTINIQNVNSTSNKNPFTPNPIQNLPHHDKIYNNSNFNNNSNIMKKQEINNINSNNMNQVKCESEKEKQQLKQKIILTLFQSNIYIPFFNDGIGSLQFLKKGKLFIVGNKNSQMFYLYENFPASNLKHDTEPQAKRSIHRNKISYSVFRGITKGIVNNIDLSACNKYLIISSNKGTFHLFGIPKKNEQINENSSFFDYDFYNENNNRIVNAVDIEKIKYSGFIENCGNYVYKTASKLLSGCKIDLDDLDSEIKKHIVKTNFAKKINANLLVNFSEYDSAVNIHLLHNEKSEKSDDSGIYNFNFGGLNGFLNTGFSNGFGNPSVNCFGNLNASINNKATNKSGNNARNAASSFFGSVSSNSEEKKEKIFLVKKIDLSESLIKVNCNYQIGNGNFYSEKVSEINTNYKNLLHKAKLNYYKPKNNLKQFIDWETTTRNFPTLQTHPLFTFNYYKKQRSSLNNLNSNSLLNLNNNCNSNSNIIPSNNYSNNNTNTNNNGSNFFEINLNNNNNNINNQCNYSNNNTISGANLNSNKNSGFNLTANNINNLIQNKNSRNNHNTNLMNNLNSNNSNSNFQIIQNLGSHSNTNNNSNSNLNQGLNSFVNISCLGNNKEDSNTANLEIIIDNDKKEFVNVEKICDKKHKEESSSNRNQNAMDPCENKINDVNYFIKNENINVKKIKKNKLKNNSRNNGNNEKEKPKNINLKYKKQIVFDNSISINSSSYSLGSSMEKNKIKFLIEKSKSESESKEVDSGEANQSSNDCRKVEARESLKILDLSGAENQPALGINNQNPKSLLDSEPNELIKNKNKNYHNVFSEEIKGYSKTPMLHNLNINENLKFLIDNQKGNSLSNEAEISGHNVKENNESEMKCSNISNLSGNKFKNEFVQSATIDSNANRITPRSNYDTNRILNHKKSFDSSINQNNNFTGYNSNYNNNINNNLNNSAIDNLIAERLICNDLEYFEINFNSNKQIQKSDFFLDNYIGPRVIINPFDVYSGNSNNNSRKNTRENTELRSDSASSCNKDNKTIKNNNSINKESNEKGSIYVNSTINVKSSSNNNEDDFYNNKEFILKKKIQEAMNSNIMDRIVSSSDSIVRFTGEIKIDEDYIKK